MHHRKTEPVRRGHFHQPGILEFAHDSGPDPLPMKPFFERLAHSHVATGQQCVRLVQGFWKVAPELFCHLRDGTKSDAGAPEPVIECLRPQAAGSGFVGQHDIEPVRLQLIDEWPDLRLTANHMDRFGKIKRRL